MRDVFPFVYFYMVSIPESQLELIKKLCEQHRVESLFLFGSAAKGLMKSDSDVDFLVSFRDVSPDNYFDNYFDLKLMLESILQRPVDLLESKALQNPYLKKSIEQSKQLVYR